MNATNPLSIFSFH